MFFMAAAFSANACAIFSCVAIRNDVSSLLLPFSKDFGHFLLRGNYGGRQLFASGLASFFAEFRGA